MGGLGRKFLHKLPDIEILRNLESPFVLWIQIDTCFLASTNYEFRDANSAGSFTTEPDPSPLWIHVTGTLGGFVNSSDATLSALALENASDDSAIIISPVFASGTTSYTASVDNDVDEITINPTVNESHATFEYLDSSDTEITDADSGKTGQQVSLTEGANTIKVKVTADDATTNTYTVVVTRAAVPMQTVVTYIGNSAQVSSIDSSIINATAFTTGGNSGGYELSSVVIYVPVRGFLGVTPKVEIFEDSAGDPGTLHATLNNPSPFQVSANTFNAPRNTTLRASTTYWLVSSNSAQSNGQGFRVFTGNATADTGSTAGWSIDNARSKNDITDALWTPTSARIIFAVRGTVAGGVVTNTAAAGAPTVTGAAQVGRTLTAVTTGITDADGLTNPAYTYQWIRVDGTDADDIAGANSSTYTLDDADLDKTIRVEVSFTDDDDNSETLISRVYPTSGTVQANNTLVSNVGQTTTNAYSLGSSDFAQSFTTGANATGYTLSSIELKLDSSNSTATPAVKLYSGSANGTAEATTFTGPAMLDAASSKNYAFTPTSTVTLLGSTTYWVVAEATTDVRWNVTGVSEDTITPATGWIVADNYEFRAAALSTGSFTRNTDQFVLQIRVNGTLGGVVLSNDATLSALALENASDDSAIIISPVFASGTTSYTASVDNDVDEITINPTVNESHATFEYLDSSDTAITDADSGKTGQQVSLVEGANTIKVKVTAQDTTTDTYTVVVTRAATVPGAPTGLVATAAGAFRIDLAWTAPDDTGGSAITGYRIEVSPDGSSDWTDLVANTASTATTYAHTGLNAATTRHYRVSAINDVGTSVPSDSDDATTAAGTITAQGDVWSGTVTVAEQVSFFSEGYGYLAAAHPLTVMGGTLSDDDFDIGGTTYTVWRITIDSANGRPVFVVATGSPPAVTDLPGKDELILRLTYGGETGDFALSDATYSASRIQHTKRGFRWGTGAHPSGTPSSGETMTVTLLVSAAPTAADNTVLTPRDTAYPFTATDFVFADANASDTLASVRIVSLPAAGTLALAGAAVTTNQVVTRADIDGNSLTFTPGAGESGDGYASFTFKVNDGTVDSDDAYTMTIDVTVALFAPGPPTELAATASGQFRIYLAWTAPANTGGSPITGYRIEVSPDGTSDWTDLVADTASTATTYDHTGLNAATTRYYRVSAINAVGTSVPSGSDDATTETAIPAGVIRVPLDSVLKPADIGAGERFRLMFFSSTVRDATSTDIAVYNTWVRTRAAAGLTAIQTYADDFTALVSTESVNARANTQTRATDTDAPIYWVNAGTVGANQRVRARSLKTSQNQ